MYDFTALSSVATAKPPAWNFAFWLLVRQNLRKCSWRKTSVAKSVLLLRCCLYLLIIVLFRWNGVSVYAHEFHRPVWPFGSWYPQLCFYLLGRSLCRSGPDPAEEETQKKIDQRMKAIKHRIVVVSGKGGKSFLYLHLLSPFLTWYPESFLWLCTKIEQTKRDVGLSLYVCLNFLI